jgi:hypothetical protein
MKAPDLKKWDLKPELEGVLFFAQLINELLFDYTIDTYKVPALNSRTLALELLNSIEDYEKKFLRQGAIKPIALELADRIRKDPVVREIIKDYFEEYIELLIKETSIPQLKIRVSLLVNKIEGKYFPMSKVLLKDSILNPKEKEKIARLTRIYIVELIDRGYSPQFIYFESERFFFTGSYPQRINTPEVIDEYFDSFSAQAKNINVMYRASKNFNLIKEHADALGIEICEEVPKLNFRGQSPNVESFLDENSFCPLFVIVKDNESLDLFKAREDADTRLSLIESLARYHVHRRDLVRSENALVYSEDQREFGIQKKPNPSEGVKKSKGISGYTLLNPRFNRFLPLEKKILDKISGLY